MAMLWKKEFRTARPYLILSIVLGLSDFVFSILTQYPDQLTLLVKLNGQFARPMEYSLIYLFQSFAIASMLIMREYDDGTIEFLDSLPISRDHAFIAKFGVTVVIIAVVPLIEMLSFLPLHLLGRTSIDPSFHWHLLVGILALHFAQIVIFSCTAFLLVYLRRFAWMLMAILFWAYRAVEPLYPWVATLNPFALIELQISGTSLRTPWKLLVPQLVFSGLSFFLSYLLFTGRGDDLAKGFQRMRESPLGRFALLAGTAGVVILWLAIVPYWAGSGEEDEGTATQKVIYPSWNKTSTAASEHFDFVYPVNLESQALTVIQRADSIEGMVAHRLGKQIDRRVFVDMTQRYVHYAGTANWLTINLDLAASKDDLSLLSTFAHELTHVFIDVISDRRLLEDFSSTRFFHEGLARYVAYREIQDDSTSRLVAAVIHKRAEVDFKMLVDNSRLTRRHDHALVYPFGERFIKALVNKYGEMAPVRVVQSFGEPDLFRDASGITLWYEVFRTSGYSLEGVVSEFYRLLESDGELFRDTIARLPRVKARVEVTSEAILIEPQQGALPDGWRWTCRLRTEENAAPSDYSNPTFREGQFRVARGLFATGQFECQLGLVKRGSSAAIYEPWFKVRF